MLIKSSFRLKTEQTYVLNMHPQFKYEFSCLFTFVIWANDTLQEQGTIEGLTWDCSDEFDATSDQPISFLSDQSFVSFPNWISRTGAMVSFKVHIYKILFLNFRNLFQTFCIFEYENLDTFSLFFILCCFIFFLFNAQIYFNID